MNFITLQQLNISLYLFIAYIYRLYLFIDLLIYLDKLTKKIDKFRFILFLLFVHLSIHLPMPYLVLVDKDKELSKFPHKIKKENY